MATHSSILAQRIPWPEEPGGLLSVGSHRVGHDLSDLAAAATAAVLSVYMCLQVSNGFLIVFIYMGLVFVSIQPVCVFWLEHLIHLHLKQLLIYMFLLPFSKLFGVDFVDLFISCISDYVSLFNICCKVGLVVLNSLNFCLSEKLFYLSINFE